MEFHAHSIGSNQLPQTMREHAENVARDAAMFASWFGAEEEGRLSGHLHDAGKCALSFMERLAGREKGLDHWTAGAWLALTRYRSPAAALAIQGHHVGLQHGDNDSLRGMEPSAVAAQLARKGRKLTDNDTEAVLGRLIEQGVNPVAPKSSVLRIPSVFTSDMLDVRMLFSALVDADFLDTEAHFDAPRLPGLALEPDRAFVALQNRVEDLARTADASDEMRQLRNDLWRTCLDSSGSDTGVFTLSAPTGCGKTLAMLGFALSHAMRHGLRRIVVIVPYLSIIDQTAAEYRRILEPVFGPEYVLEHHSLAGTRSDGVVGDRADADELRRRELAENWDAPIIVTTSVQMLESMFANRPGACRKLHRLAQSVILLDEVQTLPVHLAVPTLKALSRLGETRYRTSIVFTTATQPAFDHLHEHVVESGANSGWQPREIAPKRAKLFGRLRRVKVDWSRALESTPWSDIAARISSKESDGQVLCIVNLRRHARELAESLQPAIDESLRHLSTNMCPAHRLDVLEEIRERLLLHRPCRLVSTSCVEAGVDLDFPRGMRMFADLSAIAQAAGRVNRHGNRERGMLEVFCPDDDRLYPTQAYEQAAKVTEMILRERGQSNMDIDDPALFDLYFRRLYDLVRPDQMRQELQDAIARQDYVEVARLYRLIPESGVNILVPYAKQISQYEALADEARRRGLTGGWVKRARSLTVSVYLRLDDPLLAILEPIHLAKGGATEDWYICLHSDHYSDLYGLSPPDVSPLWIA